jgi:hypothetical protein
MTTATESTKSPHLADAALDDSSSDGRSMGFKALSRIFLRPVRKGRPMRTQLLVVARHRRAALSKSR